MPQRGQRNPPSAVDVLRGRARPPTTLTVTFIDEMRERGRWVESICEVLASQCLHVAPGSYRAVKVRPPADRDQSDANLLTTLHALREPDARGLPRPEVLYGRRKMTAGLRRNGFPRLSKHTVNRLMRSEGMNVLARSREVRTAIPPEDAKRAWDLLNGDFTSGPLRTTLEPPILPCVATRRASSTWPSRSTSTREQLSAGGPRR